ncbi:Pristinamycin IIA synthase subunit B [Streptomyces sp. YIM 130001]|uniref:LLM class flavin-dependent oxidoreductase n=1 Tax=Streptomyces sp. YIM 130001 TaxID=2259644 RepID=UPI000E647880|nr:LLM class flavin-dependent oxidoreductase [Streptomyces sp. YIM 130001]RII13414.1 Pristinamycin IIA synthase subunit B [Streptomyces sp. YIM 130001]
MSAPALVGRVTTNGADTTLDGLTAVARAAEAAGLDALLLDDTGAAGRQSRFETTTLVAALAARTEHIGLIVSPFPADQAPYHVARIVASLDHLGRGRIGWLAGTADDEGRTAETIEIARGLWDSFDDDAYVHDRADGLYWRLDTIHRLDHHGRHFDVAGPLNVARPPQGHPVVAVHGPALAADADLVLLDDPRDVPGVRAEAPGARILVGLPGEADAGALPAASDADGIVVTLEGAHDPFLTRCAPAGGRTDGTFVTLRERLGLERPASRYAVGGV